MEKIAVPSIEQMRADATRSGEMKTDFSFILSKKLRERLGALAKIANAEGQRVVRWTDILESAVSRLTESDILELKARRQMELEAK